jgi:serine protease 16
LFNLCDESALEDEDNQHTFAGDGVIFVPSQSNDPACEDELCNIDKLCTAILHASHSSRHSSTSSMEALARISSLQNTISLPFGHSKTSCITADYNATIAFLSNEQQSKVQGTRSWVYQTCTEFGFYQTCDINSNCPFAKGFHTVESDLDMCLEAFGIDGGSVKRSIDESNDVYGGFGIEGDRIMFVNGDVDPWR